jgi:hypothetical protein
MGSTRFVASLPFIILGVIFTWLGIVTIHLGYLIGGRKSDPLDLFEEPTLPRTLKRSVTELS